MNELALFAGAGGGLLASELLGFNTVCAVEIEKFPRDVLLQRQRDGMLRKFPIWDDVCTFDGYPWQGKIDVITGGFPCQDISAAGKGVGITGARSGLWKEYARIIGEVRPRFVLAENSPQLRTRGLGVILQDLTSLGYDVRWCVLGARHVGAPHRRDRMWVLAYTDGDRGRVQPESRGQTSSQVVRHGTEGYVAHADSTWKLQQERSVEKQRGRLGHGGEHLAHPETLRLQGSMPGPDKGGVSGSRLSRECRRPSSDLGWPWPAEPRLGRVAHGVADRVDRIKAIGNGQVPRVAALAWRILTEGLI